MAEKKNRRKKWVVRWVLGVLAVALVSIGVIAYNRFRQSAQAFAENAEEQTVLLAREDIRSGLSLSGQVGSENSLQVYATLTGYPLQEVNVEVGDRVRTGDVLAQIDTTNLLYDLAQAENNLANAERSLASEILSNENSVVNAENSLASAQVSRDKQRLAYEKALAEWQDAEKALAEPFDAYSYELTVQDAALSLSRKQADLRKAEADLAAVPSSFDAYSYENSVAEAQRTLDKRNAELADAQAALSREMDAFDDYTYRNAINDAATRMDRAEIEFDKVKDAYIDEEDDRYISAENSFLDAEVAYKKAVTDRTRAYDAAVENAQKAVESAETAVADAARALEKANTDLSKAKADAEDSTQESAVNAVQNAEKAVEDAQRAYDKAVTDRSRAEEKDKEDKEKQHATAKRSLADAEKSLASSELSVANARNTLTQAQGKTLTNESSVANQQVSIDKLRGQLESAALKAPTGGVVTAVNAVCGTNPSGVLFVLEDTERLYVTARVKEYNLRSLALGQKALVQTDATGDAVFEGEITYISPKAVSDAGSTNVEFEIKVAVNAPDENIKIGMNAFLELVLAEKENALVVPLSALVETELGRFVRVRENGETRLVRVEVGVQNGTTAEITGDGLAEGMAVLSGELAAAAAAQGENGMFPRLGGFGGR